jgi:hypothetical protein
MKVTSQTRVTSHLEVFVEVFVEIFGIPIGSEMDWEMSRTSRASDRSR